MATNLLEDLVREITLHPVWEDGSHNGVGSEVIEDFESRCKI